MFLRRPLWTTNVAVLGSSSFSSDADVNAYIAAMSVQPDSTRIGHIETLITNLKSDGVWSKLTWLSLLAAHDAQAARVNAKTPSQVASAVNSPTFTTDRGYTGDGATAYLDTGLAGSTLTDTDLSFGVFVRTSATSATNVFGYSSTRFFITHSTASTNITATSITASTPARNVSGRADQQLAIGRRTGATAQAGRGDSGGMTFGTSGSVTTDTAGNTNNIRILASQTSFTNGQLSAAFWGQYLNDTELADLNTRLRTYLTAVGAL